MKKSQYTLAAPVAVVLAVGFMLLFVNGGARFSIGLIFKPMVDDLGWARGDLGVAVGLYLVISAFATFIAGRLADRLDARVLLGAGTVLGGLGLGLMALVSAPWHAMLLYGVVFAIGNGAASLTTVGVMVTRAAPGRAGLANAAVTAGASLGQLVMIAGLAVVLTGIGWRSVFVCLMLAHLLVLPLLLPRLPGSAPPGRPAAKAEMNLGAAARTWRFWVLIAMYAICGLDDFFVATHVVAFAQDRGMEAYLAGNLLAFMGLAGLAGVLAGGVLSDRLGPVPATALAFGARIAVFGLITLDQSPLSIAVFALVFGASFLVTAPLTVLFVRENFGSRHLGSITGIVTMVHQVFGAVGAWGGALVFDARGSYDAAFVALLVASAIGLGLSLLLRRPAA